MAGKTRMSPTPKPTKKATEADVARAEALFEKMMQAGKVKDITKVREQIAKKTGVWPLGRTN